MAGKRILILGATGMLGHVLFRHLSHCDGYDVYATARNRDEVLQYFPAQLASRLRGGVDADRFETIRNALEEIRPDTVINCIGIIKQLPIANDPLPVITINARLPHLIARAAGEIGARMVHVSTDCVFDGTRGMYRERDETDARDLYGRTKALGEVDYHHCVTLRTSIIGHELKGRYGLIEWFLAQKGPVQGYRGAIYSGFSTVELARIMARYVLPDVGLSGVYHVSSDPISKYDLLVLVAEAYKKQIEIEPSDDVMLDRSLDSSLFREQTGYILPSWPELVVAMRDDYEANRSYYQSRRERWELPGFDM